MTGKSKPDLGIILVDEVKAVGDTLSGNLLLSNGVVATAAFECAWPPAEGGYFDVEKRSRDGDAAFIQVKSLGKGETLATLPKKWFTDAILSVEGRYGAYGAPQDVKIKDTTKENANPAEMRDFDISFTSLSPGSAESPRKGLVRALQVQGTSDVLMLVCSSSALRWKKDGSEAVARKAATSFRIAATRKSSLEPVASSDYRFGQTSGPSNMKSRNDGF